jgi:hypothetical protein
MQLFLHTAKANLDVLVMRNNRLWVEARGQLAIFLCAQMSLAAEARVTLSHKSRAYLIKPQGPLQGLPYSFLALPTELRNLVYSYTLTTPNGAKVRWKAGKNRRQKKPIMFINGHNSTSYPINQLLYVNRQLRMETAGLEIQFNCVTFSTFPSVGASPIKSLLVFSGRCTPKRLQWLTHVKIQEQVDSTDIMPNSQKSVSWWLKQNAQIMIQLLEFCVTNTHIRVDFHVPYFNHSGAQPWATVDLFWQSGIYLTCAFRAQDVSQLNYRLHGVISRPTAYELLAQQMLGKHCGTIRALGVKAENLKLLPEKAEFDAEGFREVAMKELDRPQAQVFVAAGGVDKWVSYAQKWAVDGI